VFINDDLEAFNFGQSLSFKLNLSGPAVTNPNGTAKSGSEFDVYLYDNSFNSYLTSDGLVATVNLNLNGSITPVASRFATITPEPTSFALLSFALVAFGGLSAMVRHKRTE
jgi:hypothetical protein